MTHDKLKEATRARMTETGESYTAARTAILKEQEEAQIPLMPNPGTYVLTYVDPTGQRFASIHVTREYLERCDDSGRRLVRQLDKKIEELEEK